jgi:hypothetical protein
MSQALASLTFGECRAEPAFVIRRPRLATMKQAGQELARLFSLVLGCIFV